MFSSADEERDLLTARHAYTILESRSTEATLIRRLMVMMPRAVDWEVSALLHKQLAVEALGKGAQWKC